MQGVAGNCMVCRVHMLGLAGAGGAQLGSEGIFEAICFLKLEGDNWNQMFAALCVKYS